MGLIALDLEDSITQTLADILEQGRAKIQARYEDIFPNEPFRIFKDWQKALGKTPSIEIVRDTKDEGWEATRVRRQTYNYAIYANLKSAKPEIATKALTKFAYAIQNFLNDFDNLGHVISGTKGIEWFDSLATSVDTKFRRAFGFRSAKITWHCYVLQTIRAEGITG